MLAPEFLRSSATWPTVNTEENLRSENEFGELGEEWSENNVASLENRCRDKVDWGRFL